MPYCRNCGREISAQAAFCPGCGVAPPKGNSYCQNCGNQVASEADVCVKCGARLAKVSAAAKSKVASVLLAVFLGFWTWLYTYKKDRWKFWLGLGLNLVYTTALFILLFAAIAESISPPLNGGFGGTEEAFIGYFVWSVVGSIVLGAIWIWSIVDTAIKSENWYKQY